MDKKKELTFDELIQMYGQKHSKKEATFQTKQLTFENVWDEIPTYKPVLENEHCEYSLDELSEFDIAEIFELNKEDIIEGNCDLNEGIFQEQTYFRDKKYLLVNESKYSDVNLNGNDTTDFQSFLNEIIAETQPELSRTTATQVNYEEKCSSVYKKESPVKHEKPPLTKIVSEDIRYHNNQTQQHQIERTKFGLNVDRFPTFPKTNIKPNEEEYITYTNSSENNSRLSYKYMSFNDLIKSVKNCHNPAGNIMSGHLETPHLKYKNNVVDVPPIKTNDPHTNTRHSKLPSRCNKQAHSSFFNNHHDKHSNNNKLPVFDRKLQTNKQESGSFDSEKGSDEISCTQNIFNKIYTIQAPSAELFKNNTVVRRPQQVQCFHGKMSFNALVSTLQESDKRPNFSDKSDLDLINLGTSQTKQAPMYVTEVPVNKTNETCYVNNESSNLFHYISQFSTEKCLDSLPRSYNYNTSENKHPQSKPTTKNVILVSEDRPSNLTTENLDCMSCFDLNDYKRVGAALKSSGTREIGINQESTDCSKMKVTVEQTVPTHLHDLHSCSPQKRAHNDEIMDESHILHNLKGLLSEADTIGEYPCHTSQTLNEYMNAHSNEDKVYQIAISNELTRSVPVINNIDNYPPVFNRNNTNNAREKEFEFSHARHSPFISVLEEKLASKGIKSVKSCTLKSSEEEMTKNVLNISHEIPLENLDESDLQLSLPVSARKSGVLIENQSDVASRNDLSRHLFSKEMLESIIKSFKINKTVESKFRSDKENYFRKNRIKRYRKGHMKIYQIKVALTKRKPLTERHNTTLSFDDVIDIMSQEFENTTETVEVTLSRPGSFETDATKSECLSTGSAENLQVHEKKIRRGLNIITKDNSLLFTGSDNILQEQDKNEIIMKIQNVFLQVWNDITSNKFPQIVIRKQSYENCVFLDNMLQLKPFDQAIKSTIHYSRSKSKLKFCLLMFLLNKIKLLLETNTYLTKREIYYQLKDLIAKQSLIDSAINNISCLLNVGPWELNILAQKGLVYGDLKIRFTSGEILNCSIPGVLIPCNLNEIVEIQSQAYFILVVEKEAIYHKLLQEDLPNRLTRPFILVTGKGFPDLNTQRFLKKLWIIMSIPVFILVDGDFHGINIMLNYRYGSLKNAHLSQYLAIPNAKWIGVLPSEMVKLGVKREPLSERERGLIANLMQSPYMIDNPNIKDELKVLLKIGCKGGIEGLIKNNTFLSEVYLPSKFYYQEYI